MALDLAAGDYFDFGDVAEINGLSAISIAFTLIPNGVPTDDKRFVYKWGLGNAFLCATQNTTDVAFLVHSATSFYGRRTNGFSLADATLYRIIITYDYLGGSPVMICNINGTDQGFSTEWVASNAVDAINVSSEDLGVGFEVFESAAGVPGVYSEIAVWNRALTAGERIAYGKGYSPLFFSNGGIIYCQAINTAHCLDEWNGYTVTQFGTTNAAHPRIIRPAMFNLGLAIAGGVTHQLAGSLNSASQLTGLLNLTQRLSGTLNSASHASGVLRLIQRLKGAINSISTLTGRLRLIQRISGLINSRSHLSGDLTIQGGPVTHQLSGSLNSSSIISGTVRLIHSLSGAVQSASQLVGNIRLIQRLKGVVNSISTLTGKLILKIRISGSLNSTTHLSGDLHIPITHSLSGSLNSTSHLSGTLIEDRIQEIILASGTRTLQLEASGIRTTQLTASGYRTLQLTASGTKE